MTDELWNKFKENGRKRSISDVLYGDCIDQLGENEQDQLIEEMINANKSVVKNNSQCQIDVKVAC